MGEGLPERFAEGAAWNEVGSHTSNGYMGPTASDMYLGLRVAYSQSDYKSSNGSGGYD